MADGTPDPGPGRLAQLRNRARERARTTWTWIRASTRNALFTALAVAVVGGVVPVFMAKAWDVVFPPPEPPACPGAGCDDKNPQNEGCTADAVSWQPVKDNPVALHLRYSKHCQAVWARVTKAEKGDAVTLRVDGGSAQSAVVAYGRDQFTPMSAVTKTFRATACVVPTNEQPRQGTWRKYCVKAADDSAWR